MQALTLINLCAREQSRARNARWRAKNPEASRAAQRRFNAKHPDRRKEMNAHWRQANVAKRSEHAKQYRRTLPPALRARQAAMRKQWFEENRHLKYAASAARRAGKFRATPAWSDKRAIAAVYAAARKISVETGVKHHVDHIVPLNSSRVCGLHVESNLQVVPALTNLRKFNSHWPDMAE